MAISPTGANGSLTAALSNQQIGKDAFLNLLILQLRNQDPMDPLENEAMLAQLAEFSALEEVQNLGEAMQNQVAATESVNNAIATTLIGKDVKAVGDQFAFDGETAVNLEFRLQAPGTATLQVLDRSGAVVSELAVTDDGLGWGEHQWSGRDANGNLLPEGDYSFRVTQQADDGQSLPATTFVTGEISGVRFSDGVTYLVVGDNHITLSEVLEINSASS